MQKYQTKTSQLTGTDLHEVTQKARLLYENIRKKTKRRPYIRSAYFDKEKIFLEIFWIHHYEKQNFRDKFRRIKFFSCALELIQNSRHQPFSKINPNNFHEILHRFSGKTPKGETFIVQIKEDQRKKQKWFMSVFPFEKHL